MTVPGPSPALRDEEPSSPEDARWTGPMSAAAAELVRATLPDLDADRLRSGTILDGRYEIGELLGQGGMGYVVAARHVVLGKRVAIKVLKPELTADPEMADRFRLEARAASSIGHPNIVDVSDFGELPEAPGLARASYFVMEHLDGQSLATRIEEEGALRIEAATDIVRQMASALHAAHLAGIVHRDVKPENVILTTRAGRLDHVKLLDFGIAKLESSRRDTGRSLVLGTPAYMSPEQARGLVLDGRADVYSLGVVLFELLTGQLPFDDPHPLLLVRRHATQPIPPIRELRAEIPAPLATLVTAMLAKRPEERPRTMDEVADRLAPYALSSHVAVARPSPMPLVIPAAASASASGASFSHPVPHAPAPSPAPLPSARRWRAEGLAAIGLVVIGTAVGALGAHWHAARRPPARVAIDAPALTTSSTVTPSIVPVPPAQGGDAIHARVAAPPASDVTADAAERREPTGSRALARSAPAPEVVEAPASETALDPRPPRPPTFGEQNLLDPWE